MVCGFNAYSSPGEDGIFLAAFEEDWEVIISPVMKIFRAYIALLYILLSWRAARVIFLLKSELLLVCPSEILSSYQPQLFTFGNIEEAGGWMYGALKRYMLHLCQHAYQTGRSTEAALYSLVYKTVCAGAWGHYSRSHLDIEGAFNKPPFSPHTGKLKSMGWNIM